MPVTIADVARRAAVSPGTVSNVLNRPHIVREATRTRVEAAMAELDFVPNRQARALAGGLNRSIGLVIHDAANPFFAQVADGADDVAVAHGYGLVLTSSRASLARQEASLRMFAEQRVSGVLLAPTVDGPTTADRLRQAGIAVVIVDFPGGASECSVTVDDVTGGAVAARHLLDLGRRRIAFVGGPHRVRQHADRLTGVRRAARDARRTSGAGVSVRVLEVEEHTVEHGRRAGARLAATPGDVDAVVCGNDLLAVGVISELTGAGVRVPEDVAVVGYDDVDLAALVAVPVTSVRQPMAEIGRAAMRLLLSELSGDEHVHEHLRFEPELVVRASTTAG
ncbi:transcriptional regulator, LacI family [Beutenbergia cavernae DSM 12333]|uniref:Transcriptional regulator, LacI family n=1 Tax=Beutenbergia cavernae (strain ATCC BAA-8 / DSM 12333 / CCUG 43141 / JCM 11478 / NBRC 16432 / NCIMB 13614 / HKI 0122) TaxID=471853 RepID=C5BYZ7_BEUC1|nr:LacI family DNA-binding transcriptional regulator [Beutenbergia cavernae]ACQ81112.1 transcriptional regulator, LacI family [Beutenbergia cavernae DSM 12333]